MFVAKPNLNNTLGMKEFATKEAAVRYLEEYTGFEMSFETKKNKKTGEKVRIYDWELIEKLFEKA